MDVHFSDIIHHVLTAVLTELGGRRSDQGETRYKLHRAGKARSSKRPRFSDHRDKLPSTMALPSSSEAEPVKSRAFLQPEKLTLEGIPAELMIVLGWLFDTRRLLVSLPTDKYNAWVGDLDDVLTKGQATLKELETLGRLVRVGMWDAADDEKVVR